jgi:hypothetical protein
VDGATVHRRPGLAGRSRILVVDAPAAGRATTGQRRADRFRRGWRLPRKGHTTAARPDHGDAAGSEAAARHGGFLVLDHPAAVAKPRPASRVRVASVLPVARAGANARTVGRIARGAGAGQATRRIPAAGQAVAGAGTRSRARGARQSTTDLAASAPRQLLGRRPCRGESRRRQAPVSRRRRPGKRPGCNRRHRDDSLRGSPSAGAAQPLL